MVIIIPYSEFMDAAYRLKHNTFMKALNINGDMFCSVVLGCAGEEEPGRGGW